MVHYSIREDADACSRNEPLSWYDPKMRLVSYDLCYGPMPGPDDEVEQCLTLNNKGRVWFLPYNFSSTETADQKIKEKHFRIEPEAAQKLLAYVAYYFRHEHEDFLATDVGMWQLEHINSLVLGALKFWLEA